MKRIAIALALSTAAASASVNPSQARRAIVGEAAGESYQVKVCIASAIRNRGTLHGVYGLNARNIDHQPKWVFKHADSAWKESAKHDYALGCTMFGSVEDDWYFNRVLRLKPVFTIGKTRFYRS